MAPSLRLPQRRDGLFAVIVRYRRYL